MGQTEADFSTAAANAPPSVEMTGLGDRRENGQLQPQLQLQNPQQIFLSCGGKCAAFGRNDRMGPGGSGVKNAQRDSQGHPSRKTWLLLCSLSAKA